MLTLTQELAHGIAARFDCAPYHVTQMVGTHRGSGALLPLVDNHAVSLLDDTWSAEFVCDAEALPAAVAITRSGNVDAGWFSRAAPTPRTNALLLFKWRRVCVVVMTAGAGVRACADELPPLPFSRALACVHVFRAHVPPPPPIHATTHPRVLAVCCTCADHAPTRLRATGY